MNSAPKRPPPTLSSAKPSPAARAPHAQANKPRAAQPKMAAAPPPAPPVYRPQPTPKVLQLKSASAAPAAVKAPPVYRPEAKKVVQPKPCVAAPSRKTPAEKPSPSRPTHTIQRRVNGLTNMMQVAGSNAAWQFYTALPNPDRERFRYFLTLDENLSVDEVRARLNVDFNDHNITWTPAGGRIEAHCPWQLTLGMLRERADEITRYQYDNGRRQWVYRLTWSKSVLEELSAKDKNWSWKDGHILFSYDPDTQTARVFHSGPGG